MTFSLIASHKQSLGANGGTTSAIDTTGADLLVVVTGQYPPGPATVISDNKSNVWQGLTIWSFGAEVQIRYSYNSTVGSGHRFTITGTGAYPGVAISAWSGALTASDPFDKQNGGAGSFSTGSVTPVEDNELVVAGVGYATGTVTTVDAEFTMLVNQEWNSGVNMGAAMAYDIQTAATARTATFSGTATQRSSAIATFRAISASALLSMLLQHENFSGGVL